MSEEESKKRITGVAKDLNMSGVQPDKTLNQDVMDAEYERINYESTDGKKQADELLRKLNRIIRDFKDKDKNKDNDNNNKEKALMTKERKTFIGIMVASFLGMASLFSTVTGTLNSRPMSDSKFVRQTERTIEDFREAVEKEDLAEMYRIRTEITNEKKKPRYKKAPDQEMVLDRIENVFAEEITQLHKTEKEAGRVSSTLRDRLHYDVITDLSEKNSVDDYATAELTIGKLADGRKIFAPLTESLEDLGETYDETTDRIEGYIGDVSTAHTVDPEEILEAAKQVSEELRQAKDYLFGEDNQNTKATNTKPRGDAR